MWFSKEGKGGLRPVTWQGWFATVAFVVLLLAAAFLGPKGLVVALAITGAYLFVIYMTKANT